MSADKTLIVWACTSVSTCAASFFAYAVPILQVAALLVSIMAGIKAIRSRKKEP